MGDNDGLQSGAGSQSGDVFDVRRVRRLVELMSEYELAEIDLRQGKQRIRLRKEQEASPFAHPAATGLVPMAYAAGPPPFGAGAGPAGPLTPAAGGPGTGEGTPAGADASTSRHIVSPMVGTFYLSASPEAPPFVKVGDQVGPESVVCIIEAMKVFNEIPAECSGKISAVLVENGDAVEFGQKLFRIE